MATIAFLTPKSADLPSSDWASLTIVNARPVLAFDAATNEQAAWTLGAPDSLTGTLTAKIHYFMASATSGDVDIDIYVEAVSDGDSLDLDASASFGSVNSTDNTTVPGTAGYPDVISVTLTNDDGVVAGDMIRISLTRDAASDTAAGDMYVYLVELQDGS